MSYYFGDHDASGIRIPRELDRLMVAEGIGNIRPAERWYNLLLDQFDQVRGRLRKSPPGIWTASDIAWFPFELRRRVLELFQQGYRMPQEFVGTARLAGLKLANQG